MYSYNKHYNKTNRRLSATRGLFLWASMTFLFVVLVLLIISMFHQRIVLSNTHDAHPQVVAPTAFYWQDSERLKLAGPNYDYTSPAFTLPVASATVHWNCYPSPLSNVSSYTLTLVVTDTQTHMEQSSLIACNEMTPTSGTSTLVLTPNDRYTITIESRGPWTVDIEQY